MGQQRRITPKRKAFAKEYVVPLVKGMQEQQLQIEQMQKRLDELNIKLDKTGGETNNKREL